MASVSSKIELSRIVLLSVISSLFLAFGAFMAYHSIGVREWSLLLFSLLFLLMPVFAFWAVFHDYWHIQIEGDTVALKRFNRRLEFQLSDLESYAVQHKKVRHEVWDIYSFQIHYDEKPIRINTIHYRNFESIWEVLFKGKTIDLILTKQLEHRDLRQKRRVYLGMCLCCLLFWGWRNPWTLEESKEDSYSFFWLLEGIILVLAVLYVHQRFNTEKYREPY